MNRTERVLIAAALLLFLGIFGLLLSLYRVDDKAARAEQPSVGVVLHGGIDDAGWNRQHYVGIQKAADITGIKLYIVDGVTLNTSKGLEALRQLSQQGRDFVIASSASFDNEAHKMWEEGFHTYFAIPKLEEQAEGCVPYFLRLYQAEYLAGILAGLQTSSHRIGYVAPMPKPEICRSINAFAIGAREVNPQAEICAVFVGAWDDPRQEWIAAARLRDLGVDILNSHQDGMTVQRYADAHGMEYISYLEPYLPNGKRRSERSLATVFCHWDAVYETMFKDYLRGKLQKRYWMGIDVDAVDLGEFSPRVNAGVQAAIHRAKARIKGGSSIFSGEIRDNQGRLRCREGENLSDAALIHMDWYVEGVRFYEAAVVAP